MTVAAIDIGSNSVRLLVIGDDGSTLLRDSRVTGLARGVDATRRLSDAAMDATLTVLGEYADRMRGLDVTEHAAVATSAARDARNGEELLARISGVLGAPPQIISGGREAQLAFAGATRGIDVPGRNVVVDIGGGSTEIIEGTDSIGWSFSYDIGSVRLTDRSIPDRPAPDAQVRAARAEVDRVLADPPVAVRAETVTGVAGTFTSLAGMHLGLPAYDADRVHGSAMRREDVDELVRRLAPLSVAETAAIPSLQPARAPVILAGAIVAQRVMEAVGADQVRVSEHDLLDALAAELLGGA